MNFIIELANTHGGDINYLLELIDTFSEYNENYAMKFQPLKAETLAVNTFEWYPVYEQLEFDLDQWNMVLTKAKETKLIWLDLFDNYGVDVLESNLVIVDGIKLQVSVLFNYSLFERLKGIDLSNKKIIINVAALTLEDIHHFVNKFKLEIKCEELLLEVGFQGYPTELMDLGISKIATLKEHFSNRIVFADHVDGKSEYALWLPIMALNLGADIIEKHVMLETRETKYDFYSSITPVQFKKLTELIQDNFNLKNAGFLNQKESNYLSKSLLKPILNKSKKAGEGLSLLNDFEYKRSNEYGLNAREIEQLLQRKAILGVNKKKGEAIKKNDLKAATIAVIIACRLKSSRLKEKALLKIGDLSSVEFCIKNAKKMQGINHVILATSNLESDAELVNYTFDDSVIFHKGHPEDVMQRYIDIIDRLKIDIVIRVTADMPFIDNEILQILINSHLETGADYTSAKEAAVGTNLEIINTQALKWVKSHFPNAEYSEYMTWYFINNKEYFNINMVDLPESLVRHYRLTLDYDEDLTLFNLIHDNLSNEKPDYDLKSVFEYLDTHPESVAINNHIQLKYKTDESLIATLNEMTKIKEKL